MKTEDLNRLLQTFRKAAEDAQEDLFRARLMRRSNPGDLAVQWASMRGVRLEHLAAPEAWISKMAEGGGGHFSLLVAHERKPGETLGELIVNMPGPETNPQRQALQRPDWEGPSVADFLKGEQVPTSAVPRPAIAAPAGAASPTTPYAGVTLGAQRLADAGLELENRALREQLERARRDNELEKLDRRHREDMEALRREVTAQPKQEGPNVIQLILEQGKQNAEMMRELSRQQREDQAKAEERMLKMVEVLTKKEKSPLEEKLLASVLDSDARSFKNMESVTSITNALTQSAMGLMTHQVEMMRQMAPEDEGPFLRIAEKVADAALASGKETTTAAKQLTQQTHEAAQSAESDAEAREAFQAVEESVKAMRPAAEIVPALISALQGDPLKSLLAKHKGDLGEVVKERFTAWVLEDPQQRLGYVKSELFKVEMALIAVGAVRPSTAYKQAMVELQQQVTEKAQEKEAAASPGAAAKKPTPPPPFKPRRNGVKASPPAPAEPAPETPATPAEKAAG